jgi:DNA transformation protein
MTTKQTTVDFILDQLSSLPTIRVQKMFGEYALYYQEKVVALICDDQLFVKYTDPGKKLAEGKYEEGSAYPGAKPSMLISDAIEERDFLSELIMITASALPIPKPKKKR